MPNVDSRWDKVSKISFSRFVFLFSLFFVQAHALCAERPADSSVVQAKLIAARDAIAPDQSLQISVALDVPTGWHIYGHVMHDVGLPTTVAWHLPDGFSAAPIQWPPEENFAFQGITSQGYTGHVLLAAIIRAPKDLKLGQNIPLAAHTEWLVCKDICIPESADLLLTLPVDKASRTLTTIPAQQINSTHDFFQALIFAFLGGIILNLMPCVFPILSMKALGLIKKSHYEDTRHIGLGGLTYAAGVIVSFWVLAAALIILKNAGAAIGWGVQLQSPAFVVILAVVLFLIGLSLSDILRINGNFAGAGQSLTARHGHLGTFFTGALAVLVATPCTAPFMGGAMFYAFTQPWPVTAAVFTALGVGLAAPYLILTLYPSALRYLPKPGAWMVVLKKILAIPMYAATVWLMWVFVQQVGAIPMARQEGEPYSAARLSELRAEHRPVLVNMTAAWCITCIVNEKSTLSASAVRDYFAQHHIAYLVGDWTHRDAAITEFLAKYARVGVPLYVYFPAAGTPVILPQILTPDIVIQKLL